MNKALVFILLTLGLLATASALGTPVLKKSLYLRSGRRVAYDIFRTKDSTISFSTDHPDFHQVDPTYRVLGFSPSSVTEILRNTTRACEDSDNTYPYMYSRLAYSEKTDSLLYFCYLNQSLLVLDQHSYTVQKSIPLSFYFPYLEFAKLYPENDSLIILLINSGYNQGFTHNFNSTVFIRVNLTSQQVTQYLVLDKGFGPRESVVSYAGDGTNSYILTNVYDERIKNTTVYSFTTSGNNYNATSLHTETFNFSTTTTNDMFSQLYVAGDFVMTTNNGSILVLNKQGQVVTNIGNVTLNSVDVNGWKQNPQFFEGRNKTFYYETPGYIWKLTVQGTVISTTALLNGTHLQVARGNSQKGDQIFYLQAKATTDDTYYYVLDLDTSKIISQVPQYYDNIFTTNTTYGILNNKTISIFGWNNETLLRQIKLEATKDSRDFYTYDSENSYFYYMRSPLLSSKCDLVQIDIRTGASRNISSLNGASLCNGRISQINSSSLDFVIEDKAGGYYINSGRFGQVNFTYNFDLLQQGFAALNFVDLSIHLIHYALPSLGWSHSIYTFDNRSRIFKKQSSAKITELAKTELYLFTYFGGEKVFVSDRGTFAAIDLSTNIVDIHDLHKRELVPTRLVGNNGDEGIIATDRYLAVGLPYLYNEKTYQLDSLPTEQPLALDARASGRCNYFQTNGYFLSENVIDLYDFCGNSEKAPFLRKFLRRYAL